MVWRIPEGDDLYYRRKGFYAFKNQMEEMYLERESDR